jgi:hypothetical protein
MIENRQSSSLIVCLRLEEGKDSYWGLGLPVTLSAALFVPLAVSRAATFAKKS